MEPTRAPWSAAGPNLLAQATTTAPWASRNTPADPDHGAADALDGLRQSSGVHTGRPVATLIRAYPDLPSTSGRQLEACTPAHKRIHTHADLHKFIGSRTAANFVGFLLALSEACRGKRLSDRCSASPAVEALLALLETLDSWIDEISPVQHAVRYGNPAFRTWLARLTQQSQSLLRSVLPPDKQDAVAELAPYLCDSFGNGVRIGNHSCLLVSFLSLMNPKPYSQNPKVYDYGTGHEANFAALLYCLTALEVFNENDITALVTRVFHRYLLLMRRLQTTYWLEPAGSRGVWGLDDYQFLPFIFGASQLIGQSDIRPSSINIPDTLAAYGDEYLYLEAIRFTKQVKKGALAETSPMLNDISGVASWEKVTSGMVKMYQAEVLAKFPIMQHFLFGSLLPFPTD